MDDKAKSLHRTLEKVELSICGSWHLWPGVYQIQIGDEVHMGAEEVGFVIPRSSLVRNGNFITSGLYDSGYIGPMIACLHVTQGELIIDPNVRVAQFVVMKAEALSQYNGQYQKTG